MKSRKQRKGSGKYKNIFLSVAASPHITCFSGMSSHNTKLKLQPDFAETLAFFTGGFRWSSSNWLVCSQTSSGLWFHTTANKALLSGSIELRKINLMFNGLWTKVRAKLLLWTAIFNLIVSTINICEYLWRNPNL